MGPPAMEGSPFVGRGLPDAPRTSAGRPVSGPYAKNVPASLFAVGAGVLTRPTGFRQVGVGVTLAVARPAFPWGKVVPKGPDEGNTSGI